MEDLRDIREAMFESAPRAAAAAAVVDETGEGAAGTVVGGKLEDGEVRPLVGGESEKLVGVIDGC